MDFGAVDPNHSFLKTIIYPSFLPLIIIIASLLSLKQFLPIGQNILNLLIYFIFIGFVTIIAFIVYYFTSQEFRNTSRTKLARSLKQRNDSPRTGTHRAVLNKYLEKLGWKWTPTMFVGQ